MSAVPHALPGGTAALAHPHALRAASTPLRERAPSHGPQYNQPRNPTPKLAGSGTALTPVAPDGRILAILRPTPKPVQANVIVVPNVAAGYQHLMSGKH